MSAETTGTPTVSPEAAERLQHLAARMDAQIFRAYQELLPLLSVCIAALPDDTLIGQPDVHRTLKIGNTIFSDIMSEMEMISSEIEAETKPALPEEIEASA